MFEYNDLEFLKTKLKTDLKNGLSEKEALKRKRNNGENVLESRKHDGVIKLFLAQLKDPMIYILLIAIVVSFFLKEYSDAIVVSIVVIINACIGTFQEMKTEKALEALNKLSDHKCIVIRDGEKKQIDTKDLVKGDLVCLESGNSVGADLRIVESVNLSIDESCITGEANAVRKNVDKLDNNVRSLGDKKNCAFMSSLVVSGRGKGIVISTGMNTEIGKIANILKEDKDITPLQKKLFDLGKLLGVITVVICLIMFVIAILEKRNILDMLISSISLAVAAIPEGLPAVVTIVLAIGVQRMVRVNAIVKKLPSVETLGSVSVVCSDKTGTLTENKLRCEEVYESFQYVDKSNISDELISCMRLCNNSYEENNEYKGLPLEVAISRYLKENNLNKMEHLKIKEKEFDSTRKMMSTIHNVENLYVQYTKGAYDKIIGKCKYIAINGEKKLLTKEDVEKLNKEIDLHACNSKRMLAFASKENVKDIDESELTFLGFATFSDPPRTGVKEAIKKFKDAGVKTVMITGDYYKTAIAIGKQLDIIDNETDCISGEEIDKMDDNKLAEIVVNKAIFARVTPEHKARIVSAYKENDIVVAMTGDGVNDAPSLKKADIGIAMGITGSDVAKEASDMILLDDNFATIETAIEEGRTIYNNIKKTILFLLSSNFSEIIVMISAILLGLPLPLLAIHILVVNLLTDSIPALSLGADCKDSDIMLEKPRSSKETLFANGGLSNTVVYGTIIAMITMFAFLIPSIQECYWYGVSVNLANIKSILQDGDMLLISQTYAFIVLSITELFYSLCVRNINKSVFRKDILKNKYLNISIVGGIVLTGGMIFLPFIRELLNLARLDIKTYIILLLISFGITVLHEFKRLLFHMKHIKRWNLIPIMQENKKSTLRKR